MAGSAKPGRAGYGDVVLGPEFLAGRFEDYQHSERYL